MSWFKFFVRNCWNDWKNFVFYKKYWFWWYLYMIWYLWLLWYLDSTHLRLTSGLLNQIRALWISLQLNWQLTALATEILTNLVAHKLNLFCLSVQDNNFCKSFGSVNYNSNCAYLAFPAFVVTIFFYEEEYIWLLWKN